MDNHFSNWFFGKTSTKGGPGSGNFGHAGRPGKKGGSAPNKGGSAGGGDVASGINDSGGKEESHSVSMGAVEGTGYIRSRNSGLIIGVISGRSMEEVAHNVSESDGADMTNGSTRAVMKTKKTFVPQEHADDDEIIDLIVEHGNIRESNPKKYRESARDALMEGTFDVFDSPDLVNALKKLGYDSMKLEFSDGAGMWAKFIAIFDDAQLSF